MVASQTTADDESHMSQWSSLSVLVSGIASSGHCFEENTMATDITAIGALLIVHHPVEDYDHLQISWRGKSARFKVVWRGNPNVQPSRVAVSRYEQDECPWKECLKSQNNCISTGATEPSSPKSAHRIASRRGSDESFQSGYGQTRRWQRYKLDVPIRVIIQKGGKTSFFDGRGNELSEGGMALTAGVELLPGDSIQIEFTTPYSGFPIRQTGIVRNRTGYRYGIEFAVTSTEDAEQAERLLAMLKSM
jgi:hypothetical protein